MDTLSGLQSIVERLLGSGNGGHAGTVNLHICFVNGDHIRRLNQIENARHAVSLPKTSSFRYKESEIPIHPRASLRRSSSSCDDTA